MRRFVFLFIIGMLLIAPTACAKRESAPITPPAPPSPPIQPSDNDETYVPMNYYY